MPEIIETQFVFPGEGMNIDGGLVTPDSPILDEPYVWPGTPEFYRQQAGAPE